MLDDVTKRRINSLRQILVGKLPDPKAQVEQITNGLIYKFMNDMDEQSVSLGGKSTYFSGKFQKYSWKNLLDTKTSGVEKIKLYSDAIEQMYNNENLPELFREIFKNSFLPFKDPSTLNMFLKEINEFQYSNSENLGDAFEYLLSFMGSQGDAGQFRTPRHIIDFIVEVIKPQKNETILDPACGTAGFLISSYNHILNQNTKKKLGDKLNASDRKKIGENLNGYDISPDMVKMSLVNMYLHKFTNPKINEYDTLSSEERWNEYYDVILANPPFFSPKGGIMPHNRFGVKSPKAEVLFVDYINEHLKPNGRAGIIVPEGIIFHNGIAYKELRKKLINNSLVGVISLNSGIFQPYSGVKTSILILDKKINKELKNIFFYEVKNDGYDQSSNRRKTKDNDLPIILKKFQSFIENKDKSYSIKKEKILNSSDISLTANRYIETKINSSKYEIVKLGQLCEFQGGNQPPKDVFEYEEKDNYIRFLQIRDFSNPDRFKTYIPISNKNKKCSKEDILIGRYGASVGVICTGMEGAYNVALIKCINNKEKILNEFLFYFLKSKTVQERIKLLSMRSAQAGVNPNHLKEFNIPLPSIDKQNLIISELKSYQSIVEGAKQIQKNYKPMIEINTEWKFQDIENVVDFKRGPFGGSLKKEIFVDKGYLVYEQYHAINDDYNFERYFIDKNKFNEMKDFSVKEDDLLISCSGVTMGRVSIIPKNFKEGIINQALLKLRPKKDKSNSLFIKYYLQSDLVQNKYFKNQSGTAIPNAAPVKMLKKIPFPILSIDKQQKIIDELKIEIENVNKNLKLIDIFQNKIDEKISKLF